jgi:hypothetical protein
MIKEAAKEPLEAVDMNKDTGTATLLNNQSKAQITVKLSGNTLALTSKNPHSRTSTEYRLYSRRETNLTSAIADWVQ